MPEGILYPHILATFTSNNKLHMYTTLDDIIRIFAVYFGVEFGVDYLVSESDVRSSTITTSEY